MVVETTRPVSVARRMLAPTDELVGIDVDGEVEPVVDPAERKLMRPSRGRCPAL